MHANLVTATLISLRPPHGSRQDAAIENVIAGWNTPKVPEPRMPSFIFQGVLGWFRQDRRPIEHVVR